MSRLKSSLLACALLAAFAPLSAGAQAPALTGAAVVPRSAPNAPQIPPSDRVRGGMPTSTVIPPNAPVMDPLSPRRIPF